MIAAEIFNEYFEYRDGQLFWKKRTGFNCILGARCGTTNKLGYVRIQFLGKTYLEHRIVYQMFNGEINEDVFIDHENRNTSDNRIENLRIVTKVQNGMNRDKPSNNKSGYKGVSFHTERKHWVSQIRANGKKKYLGAFSTPEAAFEAYKKAATEYHGEYATF